MIKPTVGRKLWFHPHVDEGHAPDDQPHSAEIVHVLDDRTVNLAIFNQSGALYSRQAVQLLQDDDVPPASGHFAMWMPYQQGQAAKTEQVQAAPALQLEPLHDRISALETDNQAKFEELGDWLKTMFTGFEQKLAAVTPPAADQGLAPPLAPPDAPNAAAAETPQPDAAASAEPAKPLEPAT